MEKLTLEQIAPYLPYGLRVIDSDDGIIRDVDGMTQNSVTVIQQKRGSRGYLAINSQIYPEQVIKPILRPMDLTKPIIVEGKEVIPIVELAKVYENTDWSFTGNETLISENFRIEFAYRNGIFMAKDCGNYMLIMNQLPLFQWLFKHKFDVFGLIQKGLAIDVNTLETNPYN